MCFPTQGGENRRILLDLKTVLEDVQGEVKKEEEKRSELQLQYTTDRCAWELEKAELQSRIAQVAVRKHHLDACLCMRACVCERACVSPRARVLVRVPIEKCPLDLARHRLFPPALPIAFPYHFCKNGFSRGQKRFYRCAVNWDRTLCHPVVEATSPEEKKMKSSSPL